MHNTTVFTARQIITMNPSQPAAQGPGTVSQVIYFC